MLVALTENNERIYSDVAQKHDELGNKNIFHCPECGAKLILKQGTKNIHHFAHEEGNEICIFKKGGGESNIHNSMKLTIKSIIEEHNNLKSSELEWRIGKKIADYYCELKHYGKIKKIVIECVHRHRDIDEFRDKTTYYAQKGVYVLWIFNLARFLKKNNSFKSEMRIDEMIKECHTMYFGKVYAVDIVNNAIYAIHLDKIMRNGHTYIDWSEYDEFIGDPQEYIDEHTRSVGSHYLKRTRTLNPIYIGKLKLNNFQTKDLDSFLNYPRRVASNYIKSWW